jgi:hypothetical protein
VSLSEIVAISITTDSAKVTRAGFGVPLILSTLPAWAERVRSYTDIDGMVTDGFVAATPEYRMASALFAQNPRPLKVLIGRQALKPTLRWAITPVAGDAVTYVITVVEANGTEHVVSYTAGSMLDLAYNTQTANFTVGKTVTGATSGAKAIILSDTDGGVTGTLRVVGVRGTFVGGEIITDDNGSPGSATLGTTQTPVSGVSATVAEIVNGLRSLIDALGLALTLTDQTTYLRIVANVAGAFFGLFVGDIDKLGIAQDHADPGLATDLAAIKLEDDTWYGLLHCFNSKACVQAIAAWAETAKKLFIAQTQDSAIATTVLAGATDVAAALQTSAYARTVPIYHPRNDKGIDSAWAGRCLPLDPGSESWKFKTLAGVPATQLTSTHRTNIKSKNCNYYEAVAGVNITAEGVVSAGEFIDVIRFRDWLEADMAAGIFAALVRPEKVPYTDGGIATIEAEVRASLQRGVNAGGLSDNPAPAVTVPKVSTVASADKSARLLKNVKFTATLAGAIHAINISGNVSV